MEKRLQNRLSGCIRQVVSTLQLRAETDQELLQRFAGQRDEAAFAAVVRRHGPMILRVASRTLQNEHDAEDVFQATFLVLSQKAHTLRRHQSLGSWLYGIAYRLALKSKTTAGERRKREQRLAVTHVATPLAQITVQEAQVIMDEEISRLPEKFREPIVLCCLEGLTRDEAAQKIGCTASVLKGRLELARERLRQRLVARGLTLPCGFGAFLLLEGAAGAAVPSALISSTTKAAMTIAAGKAATTVVTAKVAALTEGVLRTMFLTKMNIAIVALVLGFMVMGATVFTYRTAAAQDDQPVIAVAQPAIEFKPKREKEAFTAWGKEIGGLQAGLGFRPGGKRAYHHGEAVGVVLRVRNVGKKKPPSQYLYAFRFEGLPAVTNQDGKPIPIVPNVAEGLNEPKVVDLTIPGKEIELYEVKLELRPASESGKKGNRTLYGTGKFQIQYEQVNGWYEGPEEIRPTLNKLATGKLELEVKDAGKLPEKEKNHADLQGIWGGEIVEFEGRRIADEADGAWKVKLLVDGDRLTLRGPSWGTTLPSGPYVDNEFTLKAKTSVTPNEIDLTRKPSAGADGEPRRVLGVYQLKGDVLRVCLGLENVKRPAGFKTDRSRSEALLVLKRAANAKWAPLGTGGSPPPIRSGNPNTNSDLPGADKKTPQKRAGEDANLKPIKLRVHIEKVNADSRSINASCPLWGEFHGGTKPSRFEHLSVSENAKIKHNGKDLKLTDLKPGTGVLLELEAASETALMVVGIETGKTKPSQGVKRKPFRMRVHIEKVNADSRSITASCMILGQIDNVFKPLRFEHLSVSENAKIKHNGKDLKLTDLKPGTGVLLELEAPSEFGLMVVGIETLGKAKPGVDPVPQVKDDRRLFRGFGREELPKVDVVPAEPTAAPETKKSDPNLEETPKEGRKKPAVKHDFANLQRLATALENYNYPDDTTTRITVWCQGGGKGNSVQVTDAKTVDVAVACHYIVDGHHDKKGLDLENVAVMSADGRTIRFVNIKRQFTANRPFGLNVNHGELVIVLQLRKD